MLFKKLIRTAWKYKAQFISMILMIAIGVGIFVGFNVEWYSLQEDINNYFDNTGFSDYRIVNEKGFSEEDLKKIQAIDGVDSATRFLSVNADVVTEGDHEKKLAVTVIDNYGGDSMSLYMVDGIEYDESLMGGWLNDMYAKENGIKPGDSVTVAVMNTEFEIPVMGTIKSSEYTICVADDEQLMPDYENFGYIYITPACIRNIAGTEFYTQINVISDLDKEDMEAKVDEALATTTMVLGKEENISYSESKGEMNEGRTMAGVLPVLFIAIAVLTMITTMSRLTANEKVQIGTFKALGFRDKRILWHYTSYGFFIGLVGIMLGVLLGYGVGYFIINPKGMMSTYIDLPSWKLYAPAFVWPVLAIVLGALTLISYLAVKKMLAGTAAEALRPLAPKKIVESRFEKSKLFHKLGFTNRWNFRDVSRHKTRSAMTLLGVLGCTLLITASLGMRDTVDGFKKMMYDDICNYSTKINLAEGTTNEAASSIAEKYDGDLIAESSVKVDGKPISCEVYDVSFDNIRFVNDDNRIFNLDDDGVYICMRLAEDYEIGSMISFSPYGSSEVYEARVAGYLRSMVTENICMTSAYAESIKLPYSFSGVYTSTELKDIEKSDIISGTQTKSSIMSAMDTFTSLMDQMVFILVAAALALGVVVLYNLGVMSYTERYRELATLKVVGFKDKKISGILISQNNWLTILGIILGLPLGILALRVLVEMLAGDYEMECVVSPVSCIFTIALTFGASLIVSYFVARKNKKINMVEALKGAE